MLHVNQLSKLFGSRVILDEVTFAVAPGEKVALVGRNGCGKTTLLRILCGEEPSDGGSIVYGPSCRLGYLGQEGQLQPERTLYEEMQEVFADVDQLEEQMRAVEEQLSFCSEAEMPALLKRYDRLQNRFEHCQPHLVDAKIATVLTGMGFKNSDFNRLCREFSGGWQMRGAMARMLLREPDLMLLDEPTNHLDVQTVEWLEDYLSKTSAAVLLVSHDRYFLDKLVKCTLELRQGKITSYAGNYTFYLQERELRREQQQAAYDNQQKRLAQEMKFVERFRYKATLATRVQSRMKMIEKRQLIEAPDKDQRALKASFAETVASGEEVLNIHRISKSYGERIVLKDLSLQVRRGECVALVGANGVGKSTLLRLLANLERPDSGTIKAGYKIAPVYYAQHQAEALDDEKTVLEEAAEVAPQFTDQTRIRTILGCLLFEGDDVNKKVGILSGGERSRVALSRCILTPSNLLLLDEPTNHLDITAREALLDALQNYEGTIILVTHDRHFMNSIATCIVEIRDYQAFRYIGNYDDYHLRREAEKRREEQALAKAKQSETAKTKTQIAKDRRALHQNSEPKKIRWKLEVLEKRIFELEDEVAKLGERLGDPDLYSDPAEAQKVQREYEAKKQEAEELTQVWDEMTS